MRNTKPNSNCEICGKDFYASPGHKKAGWGRFCSMKCRSIGFTGSGNGRWMGDAAKCICLTCGNEFRTKPSHIANGDGKYCSKECKFKDHRMISVKCYECGVVFLRHQCHAKKVKNNYCSQTCAGRGRYRENNQMNKGVQRGKGGKRDDIDGMYFRSSWEANYARYLTFLVKQKQIAKWEYEVDTFEFLKIKRGTRFYTPDFKVFNTDGSIEYHEVKGYFDKKTITRHKRMDKYYPAVKIEIIDKSWFRVHGRMLSGVIKNWEKAY